MILPTSSFALEGGYGADWGEQVIYPSIVLYSSTDKYEKWTDPYYIQGKYDSRGSYFYVSEFITMMHEFGQLDWKVSYDPYTNIYDNSGLLSAEELALINFYNQLFDLDQAARNNGLGVG